MELRRDSPKGSTSEVGRQKFSSIGFVACGRTSELRLEPNNRLKTTRLESVGLG
jgi:hypothetical protein